MVFIIFSILSIYSFIATNAQLHTDHIDFNFVAAGDWGCDTRAHETVSDMQNKNPELVLALGDLSYQRESADCWIDIVSPIASRMKIVLGDQDYRSNSVLRQYKSNFNLSQDYYSFDYRYVHFVALATELPFGINSPQYQFVKKDLETASQNPMIKWIVVYSYRPQYSSPTEHPGNKEIRDAFHPLFQKYSVDLVLQAHSHNYQRTYPIEYNEKDTSNPIITDKNEAEYNNPEGVLYAVVGTAGADLHKFTGQAPYVVKQYRVWFPRCQLNG
jgi:hypothetical protein